MLAMCERSLQPEDEVTAPGVAASYSFKDPTADDGCIRLVAQEVAEIKALVKQLIESESQHVSEIIQSQHALATVVSETSSSLLERSRVADRTSNAMALESSSSLRKPKAVPWQTEVEAIGRRKSRRSMLKERKQTVAMKQIFETARDTLDQDIEVETGKWTCRPATKEDLENVLDSILGFVISVNAVFIGISMDHEADAPMIFLSLNALFTSIFLAELATKVCLNGVRKHFGEYSNIFDAVIVIIDFLQLCLLVGSPDNGSSLPSASLLRTIRLLKLTRLIRLLSFEIFRDLLSMIRGLIGGVTVLWWSIVLFVMVIYVLSLVSREAFGRQLVDNVYDYFESVPRAMFTTFRCSFGDCSTASGTPIFEHVQEYYGAGSSVLYSMSVFVVTVGLFNVISAIFVESTMVAREAKERVSLRARLEDERLWATSVALLVRRLVSCMESKEILRRMDTTSSYTEFVHILQGTLIDAAALRKFIEDPDVVATLAALDIDPEDNPHLLDICDPSNSGTILVQDFVDGLGRLRGRPRRSDIVAVDLMIRALQLQVTEMCDVVSEILCAVQRS
eukprot:TRINITY_DN76580_c0_g1_i1.p1 TRINITY_DN76580_c0_g1~~TRINITY_DN76580_c0_g1_i1.p1  ORF type:complete len:565 (-),score=89.12 TRINITY_DN76580_c0_g1_i1:113-1807(-)